MNNAWRINVKWEHTFLLSAGLYYSRIYREGYFCVNLGFAVTLVYSVLYVLSLWQTCCHNFLSRTGSSQFEPDVLMESKVFLAVRFQLFVWDIVYLSPCVHSENDTIDHKSEHLPRKQNDNWCSETSIAPTQPCGDGSGKFEVGDFQHFPGFSAFFVSLPSAFPETRLVSLLCHAATYWHIFNYFCVALKNPAHAEEVQSAVANEIRKTYLVQEAIWVEPYDEVEMRRSFLSGVAEQNFGVLNVSGGNPPQTSYWYIARTEITTFAFTNAWCESRAALMSSINLFTEPVCPYRSRALQVMTYACLLTIPVWVCVSLFFVFLFSTVVSELTPPQVGCGCGPWNVQLLLWCPLFYFLL